MGYRLVVDGYSWRDPQMLTQRPVVRRTPHLRRGSALIQLRFGLIADYAGQGANSKLILVGIFDTIFIVDPNVPIVFPLCYLAVQLSASVVDGSVHRVKLRLMDEDGGLVWQQADETEVRMVASAPGRPLVAQIVTFLAGLQLPRLGDYAFEVQVDGHLVGEVPFHVIPQPTA